MNSYREEYLKSDHWKMIRLMKLEQQDAKCQICRCRALSNDVHHINYENIFHEKMDDLKVLCRRCHDLVHEVMRVYPTVKDHKNPGVCWKLIKKRIKVQTHIHGIKNVIITKKGMSDEQEKKQLMLMEATSSFRKSRRILFKKNLLKRESEMKWDDRFLPMFEESFFGVDHERWLDFWIKIKREDAKKTSRYKIT